MNLPSQSFLRVPQVYSHDSVPGFKPSCGSPYLLILGLRLPLLYCRSLYQDFSASGPAFMFLCPMRQNQVFLAADQTSEKRPAYLSMWLSAALVHHALSFQFLIQIHLLLRLFYSSRFWPAILLTTNKVRDTSFLFCEIMYCQFSKKF